MKQQLLERLLPGVSAAVPLATRLPGRGAVPEALGHRIRRGAAVGDRLAERDVAVSGGPAGGELAWREDVLQVQVAIEVQQKSLLVVHPCVDDAERGFADEGGSLCVGGFALADSLSVAVRKWLPPRLCRSARGRPFLCPAFGVTVARNEYHSTTLVNIGV
jgi:hypothetical protein